MLLCCGGLTAGLNIRAGILMPAAANGVFSFIFMLSPDSKE